MTYKKGDRVPVQHTCRSFDDWPNEGITHVEPVLVTGTTTINTGTRVHGIRCDGSVIEWIEEEA